MRYFKDNLSCGKCAKIGILNLSVALLPTSWETTCLVTTINRRFVMLIVGPHRAGAQAVSGPILTIVVAHVPTFVVLGLRRRARVVGDRGRQTWGRFGVQAGVQARVQASVQAGVQVYLASVVVAWRDVARGGAVSGPAVVFLVVVDVGTFRRCQKKIYGKGPFVYPRSGGRCLARPRGRAAKGPAAKA